MADVSHRDADGDQGFGHTVVSGAGSPEGVVIANVGAMYRRTDGGAATTLYVKESGTGDTGWQAYVSAAGVATNLAVTQAEVDAAETAATTLAARVTAVEANNWVTTARIIDDAVTNAELANVATATFKGRTTSGTGDPEDLTVTQATAMLNAATATLKGMVPTPPDNTTTFLRGDATFAAPPARKLFLTFGVAAVTAGGNGYANPTGFSTTPAGASAIGYTIPVAGNIVGVYYRVFTAHTTNTVVVAARVSGTPTNVLTVSATDTTENAAVSPPIAVVVNDYVACHVTHNGATNLATVTIVFEIEF